MSTIPTKVCSKCKKDHPISLFSRCKSTKDGFKYNCKLCCKKYYEKNKDKIKERDKKYREANKDKIKERDKKYYEKNRDKILKQKKEYTKINKDEISKKRKIYYTNNKEYFIKKASERYMLNKKEILKYNKQYYKTNKKVIAEKKNKYFDKLMKTDINFRLLNLLRGRIRMAIKSQSSSKAYKSIELLGCTIEKARQHLESLFQEGMTWDNHGVYGWHIDHIIPCSIFDLTDPVEQKQCFHYTNLQPLWAEDNLKKGDKY